MKEDLVRNLLEEQLNKKTKGKLNQTDEAQHPTCVGSIQVEIDVLGKTSLVLDTVFGNDVEKE